MVSDRLASPAILAAHQMSLQGTLQGVLLLSRHGDRTKFYQDPNTYTGYETHITPLGETQTYETGQYIRSRYIDPSSQNQISGISVNTINLDQCNVLADAAAEANVIVISAYSMWQGIYPASSQNNVTLANGQVVISPLSGQQYLPIQTVEFSQSPLLEAFTSCPAYTSYLSKFYNSSIYSNYAAENKQFLSAVGNYTDGRNHTLKDMYNVYDYINVNSIYNATYLATLGNTTLQQASGISNWLSYNVFTGPTNSSAGNIAGRGMLGYVIPSLQTLANATADSKIQHYSLSYKPFLSLFNMTGAAAANPELAAVVSYSSLAVMEVREQNNEAYVNLLFRNGTAQNSTLLPYTLLGRDQVKLSDFVNAFNSSALYTTLDWCRACNQTSSINNCDGLLLEANLTSANRGSTTATPSSTVLHDGYSFSPVGAGFIGAVLGLLIASIVWFFLLVASRKKQRRGQVNISQPIALDNVSQEGSSKNPFSDRF